MNYRIKKTCSNGFTLIEVLISLAIVGMLLAAVTVALQASVMNYTENEKVFKNINTARQALVRMTTQIRTAGYDVNGVCQAVDQSFPVHQCNLNTNSGENITYEYRAADNKIYLIKDGYPPYTLCDNVTAAEFIKTPAADGINSKSIRISITVSQGGVEQKLVAAAVVRKVLDL
ncbi:MAG: type II secretion system protein [Sedimentisphaerales bacterium]|nr:type II secretion system protein [Sedimentisphaerales bacterium]